MNRSRWIPITLLAACLGALQHPRQRGARVARARACAHGLRVREFETLWDVDLPAPLERLDALLAKATP
jgi:hypothetical protein